MSDRHVGGKRPNRERLVAPSAVSHLHRVQVDVVVMELAASPQPAASDVDEVGVGRQQRRRALHVMPVPGTLPTLGQSCRSGLWRGGVVGMRHVRPTSSDHAIGMLQDCGAQHKTDGLSSFQIDDELELGRPLDWQLTGRAPLRILSM
jgi:hypothetical protein